MPPRKSHTTSRSAMKRTSSVRPSEQDPGAPQGPDGLRQDPLRRVHGLPARTAAPVIRKGENGKQGLTPACPW